MNAVVGLLLWNVCVAAASMLFYLAVKENWGTTPLDHKSQLVVAWLLIGGGLFGALPTLMLLDLFPGVELLLALAPPIVTLAFCSIVIVQSAKAGKRSTDETGPRDAP